jgi:F-type H+-transporting ATPase subunit b
VNNPLVQPDPGLFIWTIVTFLVLVALLRKFAWGPLLAALDARQQAIVGSLRDVELAKAELERAHQESGKVIAAARTEAEGMIASARAVADRLGDDLRLKAQEEAAAVMRRAERDIQIETGRAIEQVRREAIDIGVAIASKVVRHTISKDDNLAIIQDTIQQIEATPRH